MAIVGEGLGELVGGITQLAELGFHVIFRGLNVVLAVIDDGGRLSKETGIVQEDNQELRTIVDA